MALNLRAVTSTGQAPGKCFSTSLVLCPQDKRHLHSRASKACPGGTADIRPCSVGQGLLGQETHSGKRKGQLTQLRQRPVPNSTQASGTRGASLPGNAGASPPLLLVTPVLTPKVLSEPMFAHGS